MQGGGLVSDAERALAAGDLARAVTLLNEAAEAQPGNAELWMKVAALHRATSNPDAALAAVHRALAVSPLDFTMLLMRASLLQRLGHPESGQAWGHALAQKPTGDLPPQIEAAVAEGERQHAAYVDAREAKLSAAMSGAGEGASEEEQRRIERFRTNVVGKTRPYYSSPTHFFFPELAQREFHPRELFPWIETLEAATDTIACELQAGFILRRREKLGMLGQARDAEPGQPALPRAEHFAAAAQAQILLGDHKPILGLAHHVEPLARDIA